MFASHLKIFQLVPLVHTDVIVLIAIAIGAVLGALSRYYVIIFSSKYEGTLFPYGTLLVNVIGAFLMGIIGSTMMEETSIATQKFLIVGFLGSYTTFSSYILDSSKLLIDRLYLVGFIYWLGCPIFGLIALELGVWLGEKI